MRTNTRYLRHCTACDESFDYGNERGCAFHEMIDDLAQRDYSERMADLPVAS